MIIVIAFGILLVDALYGVLGVTIFYRGWQMHSAYVIASVVDMVVTTALVFYVADATLFSWLFVKEAFSREIDAVWPSKAKKDFADKMGVTLLPNSEEADTEQDAIVTTTMKILFVSRRTACITRLIYFPFLLIALAVVSRSAIVGPFSFDSVFVAIQIVIVLVALSSAIALRAAAEAARRETLRRLTEVKWKSLTKPLPPDFNTRLEMLVNSVTNLREGAFSPLSQQPLIRALLLPLGSYGGTALVGYLTGANF